MGVAQELLDPFFVIWIIHQSGQFYPNTYFNIKKKEANFNAVKENVIDWFYSY